MSGSLSPRDSDVTDDVTTSRRHQQYSLIRRTLYHAVEGSFWLHYDHDPNDDDFFTGWQVLCLGTVMQRFTRHEAHEVRAIYANWGDSQMPTHPVAVLRAAYRSRTLVNQIIEHDERAQIPVPARFVWVPMEQARAWITAFEHLNVPTVELETSRDEARRRLRIDLNWQTRMFEKRWERDSPRHEELNRHWELVWHEMSSVLATSSDNVDVSSIDEKFEPEPNVGAFLYDLDAYQPDRIDIG